MKERRDKMGSLMTPPRSVEEWVRDNLDSFDRWNVARIESRSRIIASLKEYVAEQVAQARAEERETIIKRMEARKSHFETARDEFSRREHWTNHAIYADRVELLKEEIAAIRRRGEG